MAGRFTKMILTVICGAALGAGKCNQDPVEPSPPPPDAQVEPDEPDATAPPEVQPIAPEDQVIAMYGAPYEPVDQTLYGVPME